MFFFLNYHGSQIEDNGRSNTKRGRYARVIKEHNRHWKINFILVLLGPGPSLLYFPRIPCVSNIQPAQNTRCINSPLLSSLLICFFLFFSPFPPLFIFIVFRPLLHEVLYPYGDRPTSLLTFYFLILLDSLYNNDIS